MFSSQLHNSPVQHASAGDRCARRHGEKDAIWFSALREFAMFRVAASSLLRASTTTCVVLVQGETIASIVRSDGRPSRLFAVGIALAGSPSAGVLRPFFFSDTGPLVTGVSRLHTKRSGTQRVPVLSPPFSLNGFHNCEG